MNETEKTKYDLNVELVRTDIVSIWKHRLDWLTNE